MEELFLRAVLAGDELNIINHQHIDRAENLFEIHDLLVAQRLDKAIHELFCRQIENPQIGLACVQLMCDGMHQVGLAQTHAAIEEQWVKGHRPALCHPAGGGMRELVGLTHDKAVKGKAGVQRGAGQVIVCPRPTLGKLGTRLRRGCHIARCRSTGRRHKKLKPRDFLARGIQMLENVIREVPRHPIAEKAGGNFEAGQGPTQLRKTNRLDPSCVVVAANALDQVFAQLAPGLVCHSSSVPGLSG